MSEFGLPCAFLVKLIHINFQLEKYMQFKKKDIYIFSCIINVTSQNWVPSFYMNESANVWLFYLHLNNHIFDVCCVEMVKDIY